MREPVKRQVPGKRGDATRRAAQEPVGQGAALPAKGKRPRTRTTHGTGGSVLNSKLLLESSQFKESCQPARQRSFAINRIII